jgi:hypothetical protein
MSQPATLGQLTQRLRDENVLSSRAGVFPWTTTAA